MKPTNLFAVTVLTSAVAAQGIRSMPDTGSVRQPAVTSAAATLLPAEVVFDRPEEGGDLWAVGHTWKASFDRDGMTFVPFFGSDAPRNYPLRIELLGASVGGQALELAAGQPERKGDSVCTERGTLTEVLDLDLDHVEQSFRFDALPNRGAVAVEVSFSTDLAASATDGGLVFANEHGSVCYRKAVAIDAAGARQELEIVWQEHSARIEIPAAFVARAKLPLVLDPIISSNLVMTAATALVQSMPDVATLQDPERTCTVWRRRWSVGDEDCWAQLTDANLSLLGSALALDFTSEDWEAPAIASSANADNFLVVSQVNSGGSSTIRGRLISGAGVAEPKIDIEGNSVGSLSGDHTNPDVGGDPYPSPQAFYCVTWEYAASSGNRDIYMRLIDQQGAVTAPNAVPVDDSAADASKPSISKSNDTRDWLVSYASKPVGSPVNQDVRARRIRWNGNLVGASVVIADSPAIESRPSSSSPAEIDGAVYWMVAYECETATGEYNIHCRMVDIAGPRGASINFSLQEDPVAAIYDKGNVDIDSDGVRFAVCYQERRDGLTDYETLVSTVAFLPGTDTYRLDETRVSLGTSSADEVTPAISAMHSGGGTPSAQYQIVDTNIGTNTIEQWSYGGYTSSAFWSYYSSACGPLTITPSGTPAVGSTVRFDVPGGALSGTVFGSPGLIPLTSLGCNCVLGVSNGITMGNPLVWTIPANPIYVGRTLSVQGWTVLGSNCLSQIDLSDTVDFTVR